MPWQHIGRSVHLGRTADPLSPDPAAINSVASLEERDGRWVVTVRQAQDGNARDANQVPVTAGFRCDLTLPDSAAPPSTN